MRFFPNQRNARRASEPRVQVRREIDSSLGTRKGMEAERSQLDVVGIDFGTTNSSVARVTEGSTVRLASFSFGVAATPSFRSVLYFEQTKAPNGAKRTHSLAGPAAIERYLEADDKGRLIQSLKSHLPSRLLAGRCRRPQIAPGGSRSACSAVNVWGSAASHRSQTCVGKHERGTGK